MPNITLSIPEQLKNDLDSLKEINWSESVREFLVKRVKRALLLKRIDELLENSEFTEEDADRLAEKVKLSMHNRLKSEGLV